MAQDRETVIRLEEIVVTATKQKADVFDTSIPVNIIDKETIDREVARSMGDVFKNQPGLSVSETGSGSIRPQIRGLFDDRVLILVDGMRLSEQRGTGNHRLSIDPAQIERIEVIRGPASVLYGTDGIGGVINIITRKAQEERIEEFRINGIVESSFDSSTNGWKHSGTLRMGKGGFNFFFNGIYEDTDNLETADGKLPHSFYDGYTISSSGNYCWQNSKIGLSYFQNKGDIGIPNITFKESFFDGEKHKMTMLNYELYDISPIFQKLKICGSYQRHNRHMHILNPVEPTKDVNVEIFLDIDTWNLQPEVTLTFGERHRITSGLLFFREDADSQREQRFINPTSGEVLGYGPFHGIGVIPDADRIGLGIFAQDEINVTDRLALTPGVRFDWIRAECGTLEGHPVTATTEDDTAVSINLGVLYRLTKNLNLAANIGRAFRAPNLLERFFYGPHQFVFQIGNPELEPEKSLNLDVALKARYDRFRGSISLFRNQIWDFIVFEQTGPIDPETGLPCWTFNNVGRAFLYGGEAEAEFKIGYGLSTFFNLSYVRARNQENDTDLPEIPPLRAGYGVRYERKLFKNWNLWSEFLITTVARQKDVAPWENETPGYTTLDFRVNLDLKKNFSLFLTMENLTDKSYHLHTSRVRGINEQPGRNVSFKLVARW